MRGAVVPAEKIAFAHVLRGIAAFLVLVGHLGYNFWMLPVIGTLLGAPSIEPSPNWFTILLDRLPFGFVGHFAVALFFLISGFVIPFSLLGRTRLQFALSRLLRLWPTYAVGLSITAALVTACAAWFGQPRPFVWSTFFAQLLFVRDMIGAPSIDGIVWTLEIEAKFYIVMALTAGALRRGNIWTLIFIGTMTCAITVGASRLPNWLMSGTAAYHILYGLTLSGQMISFMLIGAIFNFLYRGLLSLRASCLAGAALFAMLAIQWPLGIIAVNSRNGIISYAVALLCFSTAYAKREYLKAPPPILIWLADISYPLYVVHGVAGYAIMRILLGAGFGQFLCFAVAMIFAFTAAWLIHVFVERPSQAYGKRLSQHRLLSPQPIPCPIR
jgi:peptidoglycan/LPS O-acetylase OafA/YrhL